jgi:hypothetical protein
MSADNRWIGFFTPTELKKVSIAGGPPITLCPVAGASLGASWGDDNTIVFATNDQRTGLWRVSADGGEPTALTTPDVSERENDHVFPSLLPGGRGVLFTIAAAGQADKAEVAVLDLKTGQRKTLIRGGSDPEFVDPSGGTGEAGYLIYAAAGTLRAVRFDPARLEVLGDPVTVVEQVMIKPSGAANYAVSRQGTLFYVPAGGVTVQMSPRSLVWVDRKGHEQPITAPAPPLRVCAHIARRYASPARYHRSGEQRHLDLGPRAGDAEALDLRSWLRFARVLDTRQPPDHLHVGSRGRFELVQPSCRRHGYSRPADNECEPAVSIVHLA